jgi:hypothetical protein
MAERWRVGSHYGIHLYRGDEPLGTMLTPELAEQVVRAVNERDGWVRLDEVLAALRDGAAYEAFADVHGDDNDGWWVEHRDRERVAMFIAERFGREAT